VVSHILGALEATRVSSGLATVDLHLELIDLLHVHPEIKFAQLLRRLLLKHGLQWLNIEFIHLLLHLSLLGSLSHNGHIQLLLGLECFFGNRVHHDMASERLVVKHTRQLNGLLVFDRLDLLHRVLEFH
jgi:hypothetical protein